MKRIVLLCLAVGTALAQTLPAPPAVTVEIKVRYGDQERAWAIELRERTVLSGFGCTAKALEIGESTNCVVFLNQPTLVPADIRVTLPPGFDYQPAPLLIPVGGTSVTFRLMRVSETPRVASNQPFHLYPSVATAGAEWSKNLAYYAVLMTPGGTLQK
jgi:hypothetical protein